MVYCHLYDRHTGDVNVLCILETLVCGSTKIAVTCFIKGGPGSSVGIAIGYGLEGPEIESRLGRNFLHLARPALGRKQPPLQWVPALSRG
jgi:hypothetical protein